MFCRRDRSGDNLLAALSRNGINLLLPPQPSIEPGSLMVVDRDGGMRLGDWRVVLGAVPKTTAEPATGFRSFSFDASSQLEVSPAAQLLGRLLTAFGVSTGKLAGRYSASEGLSIELRLIAPANRWLSGSIDLILEHLRDEGAKVAAEYLGRRFFLVTTAWRAKGIRLRLVDQKGQGVELEGEVLDELSGGGRLKLAREGQGVYAFTAAETQVFGLGLRELSFESGMLKDEPVATHHNVRRTDGKPDDGEPSKGGQDFVSEEAFVEFIRA